MLDPSVFHFLSNWKHNTYVCRRCYLKISSWIFCLFRWVYFGGFDFILEGFFFLFSRSNIKGHILNWCTFFPAFFFLLILTLEFCKHSVQYKAFNTPTNYPNSSTSLVTKLYCVNHWFLTRLLGMAFRIYDNVCLQMH